MTRVGCWAVVPAAGVGRRFGAALPKQYLELRGRAVIEHALARLSGHPGVDGVVVAVAHGDRWWPAIAARTRPSPMQVEGGEERCDSVLAALDYLAGTRASEQDWVLVHDAVRPCLRQSDLSALLDTVGERGDGALLGMWARDTMKRVDASGAVRATVDRSDLWHALTPQLFRLGALRRALHSARSAGLAVTDEAQAMELAGERVLMVEGHADNIKITRPADLRLAELFLAEQEQSG